MKYTLTLKQSVRRPESAELEGDRILCNDVNFPKHIDARAYNPHNVRLWVIGHEFGAICAVFASNEQDALDSAVDGNMLDCLMAEEQDYGDESLAALGNASELFDLTYAWMGEVEFNTARDIALIVALAEAKGAGNATLE